MLAVVFCFISLSFSETLQFGKTSAEWKTRVIYQILTDRFARSDGQNSSCTLNKYCGGTYKGIQNKLDYIKNLGMNAIWLSPIVENTAGSYHGYHATNWYAMNTNFGTAAELKALISAAKAKGIWVMVDVVFNHVGPVGTDFSKISPFNKAEHYHDWCDVSDWNNQWQVENCRLAGLPDLKQENAWVTDELIKWAKWVISEFSLDGIRIDTIKHVPTSFWKTLAQRVTGIYMMGETYTSDVNYLKTYTSILPGQLSFPMYYTLQNVFGYKQSCYQLRTRIDEYTRAGVDYSLLGGFIDNHDVKRFLHVNSDWRTMQNAMLFNLFAPSIPLIYYGTEQGFRGGDDPNNREPMWASGYNQNHELFKFIAAAAKQRQAVSANAQYVERYVDDVFFAFSRGDHLAVLTNQGSNMQQFSRTITYLPFANGQKVKEVFSGATATVSNGLAVTMKGGMPQLWVKA